MFPSSLLLQNEETGFVLAGERADHLCKEVPALPSVGGESKPVTCDISSTVRLNLTVLLESLYPDEA